jgi:NADH:ubiquinone oxidoreductase subunit 4 (subunit M)
MILSALIPSTFHCSVHLIVGFYPGVMSPALSRSVTFGFCHQFGLTIATGVMFDLSHIGFADAGVSPWLPDLGLNYSLAIDEFIVSFGGVDKIS